MKPTLIKTAALAATALSALATTPTFAQDANEASGSDIVVTARRVEERLQDVPISITVYNQQQIADRNIVNSTDLAIYTPSLAANSRFGTEKASFTIRGFTQDLNTSPTVGVYFADVVAPRLASNITSGSGAGVGMMFDLQNVQVLKGPQGTLFGRNTTGGAILIVPQKPTDKLEGYVEGSIGNHDLRRGQAVLNIPLADTFKVRLGVDRYIRDGYVNNRSGIGPKKFNNVNYWSARASVVAELTPDLENYTVATWSKSDTNGMLGAIRACHRTADGGANPAVGGGRSPTRLQACEQLRRAQVNGYGFYDAENSTPNPFVKQRFWQVINTTTWQASDTLTVKNIVSYAQAKEGYNFNITGDNFKATDPVANARDVWVTTTFPGPHTGQDNRANFTEEFQLQGRSSDDRLQWQAGAYTEHSTPLGSQFNSQQQYTAVYSFCTDVYAFKCSQVPVAGNLSIANNVYTYRNYGLYAQATYNLTEQFAITAGIRNTWDSAKVSADNVRLTTTLNGITGAVCSRITSITGGAELINSGRCTRKFSSKSNRPTWLLNVDYKPNEDILVYAKYARGYRGGGVNEANFDQEAWGPEKLDSYELGLKTSFSGAVSGNFNLAGFWNEFKDNQASIFIPNCTDKIDCAPTGINAIQNIGSSRIKGIEADGAVTLFDSLRIEAGYAYLDAKIIKNDTPSCNPTKFLCSQIALLPPGTRLLFAPKHRLTATATYNLPLDESLGDISVGATFVYTASQIQTHSDDGPFLAGVIPENYGVLPSTQLLNLNFTWKSVAGSPIDFSAFATNVTKEKYRVASSGGISSTGGEFVLLGEPRMYGIRLKYRFGE